MPLHPERHRLPLLTPQVSYDGTSWAIGHVSVGAVVGVFHDVRHDLVAVRAPIVQGPKHQLAPDSTSQVSILGGRRRCRAGGPLALQALSKPAPARPVAIVLVFRRLVDLLPLVLFLCQFGPRTCQTPTRRHRSRGSAGHRVGRGVVGSGEVVAGGRAEGRNVLTLHLRRTLRTRSPKREIESRGKADECRANQELRGKAQGG